MTHCCKIKIKINESDTLEFYFSYTISTTINGLIEFIAYNFPDKHICPCYRVKAKNKNKEFMELNKYWTFNNSINKYSNFNLYNPNPNKECKCDNIIRDNYTKSKKHIIQDIKRISEMMNKKSDIKIDENNGKIIAKEFNNIYKNINFKDFYDVIVDIKSIKDISEGWDIKLSERAEKEYQHLIRNKVIRLGVIGNSNSGKTFFLSKLTNIDLPTGTNIITEGLSIKYPDNLEKFTHRRIVLIDSVGFESPILIRKEEKEEKNKFKEILRDKFATELFLQNYIIYNSDILLIVIGMLTYSEQKLLNKIKLQLKNLKYSKRIFVIHNLMNFTKINQVKEYIDNILSKSITFKLEEGHKISLSKKNDKGFYFIEINEDKNNPVDIHHYIYAKECSEAGIYFNEFTINQINKYFIIVKDEPFNAIETIKQSFIDISKDLLEETEKITMDNFDNEDSKKIKLIRPKNILLKNYLINESDFFNLNSNDFIPVYNCYKKNDKLIIRIEAPGNCDLRVYIDKIGEYAYIRINGIKKKDKEPSEIKDNIFNNRKFGEFSINIPLKTSDYNIKNEQPEIQERKGIFIITYTIQENNSCIYNQREDDI